MPGVVDLDNVTAMSDGIFSIAPYLTALPDDLAGLTDPYKDAGALTTDGLQEAMSETRTAFKRWGSTATFKSSITDQTKTFDIACLEANPVVLGLFYRTANPTKSDTGTSEVQTITISGSPTGGTWVAVFGDEATTDLAQNATAAQVQTALRALPGIGSAGVTVTGSTGGPYTVTFAGPLANTDVATIQVTSNLTGGTSPAVAVVVTTPGVSGGDFYTVVDDVAGITDLRVCVFDVFEDDTHFRYMLPKAEVTARKNVTQNTSTLTQYGMTVTAYPDDNNIAVKRYIKIAAA